MTGAVSSFPVVKTPPSKPWIVHIPYELLLHILSFLTDPSYKLDLFVTYNVDDREIKVSQILVLRSVCRLFRTATAELGFWCDPDFSFIDLVWSGHYGPIHGKEEFLLKVLFSDDHLVQSLSRRKTDWKFDSVGGLDVVMEAIPLFAQNATSISLEFPYATQDAMGKQYETAFEKLAVCSGVTKLTTELAVVVNLSTIAASFPLLEELETWTTFKYNGSSRGFTRLRKLGLENAPFLSLWLPVNCMETLTELSLHYSGLDWPFFDATNLEKCTNLKTLWVGPLSENFCDYIIRSPMQLDAFATNLRERHVPINKFRQMLHAGSLRNLKDFELTTNFATSTTPDIEQYYFSVVDMFTSILCNVEEVRLDLPFHLGCCQYFGRMKNLKILHWDGTGLQSTENSEMEINKALEAAFAEFVVKPRFAVHVVYQW